MRDAGARLALAAPTVRWDPRRLPADTRRSQITVFSHLFDALERNEQGLA